MLPLVNRLKRKKEIERVSANRKSCKSGPLVCKTALNDLNVVRFCFVVSKRVSSKAVVRNKVKRRLREAVARIMPRLGKSCDCVLIACPGIDSMTFEGLSSIVEKVLYFAGILNGKK